MQEFTFTIVISADGETVSGEVKGVKGKSCESVQHVLDEVGLEIEHQHTAEHSEREPVRINGTAGAKLQLGKW